MQINLRLYGEKTGDFQAVDAWWRARHGTPFPENQVPPLGMMAEIDGAPVGCLFAYEPGGIGVAFLEFGVTRPATPFKTARMIFARLLQGISVFLRQHDYGLLRCFAESPSMRRALESFGFDGRGNNLYLLL